MNKASVITVSSSRSKKNDETGREIINILKDNDFKVKYYSLVKDNREKIKKKIVEHISAGADVVFTAGGTGLGPEDLTPEATEDIAEKKIPGLSMLMISGNLKNNKRAALSRGICALRDRSLIINLPGSPAGAKESLEALVEVIDHALDMVRGKKH